MTENEARPCPQDCAKCLPAQQLFCCTKMAFELSKEIKELKDDLAMFKAAEAYSLPTACDQPLNI